MRRAVIERRWEAILRWACGWCLLAAIPCSVGLMFLAEPIARLLFERGQFTAEDTARTGRMIAVFGSGVWAYCALPVIVEGFMPWAIE